MVNTRLFEALERSLVIYNQKALLNETFYFYTVVECPYQEVGFDFPGFVSAYFRVYNERLGKLIIDLPLDQDSSYLIANASVLDMTFEDNGNYYYEIGYSNGYEVALRYGTLQVI